MPRSPHPALLTVASLLVLLAGVRPLRAQEGAAATGPAASAATTPPTARKKLALTTGIGFIEARGNTRLTSLSAEELLVWRPDSVGWEVSQRFQWVFARTNGETSASLLLVGARVGRSVGPRIFLFAAGTYDRNRFAGILRRVQEEAGLSVRFLDRKETTWLVDAGASLTQQRSVALADETFLAGRVATDFVYRLNERASVRQTVEFLPNLQTTEDLRVNAETSLAAPLSRVIALKVSYVIRFDNLPPPGFQSTDRVLTTGLQLSL